MPSTFDLERWPRMIVTCDFATERFLATSSTTSLFAPPSTGGVVTHMRQPPAPSVAIRAFDALVVTWTRSLLEPAETWNLLTYRL